MSNKKETTPAIATLASRTLSNPNAGKVAKQLAASVLSQADKSRDQQAKKR